MNHFTSTIEIYTLPAYVFKALTKELSLWWGKQDKPVSAKGDVFRVSWGEPWYEFNVIEYEPDLTVTWECVDANQIIGGLEGVQKEWVGSQVRWKIEKLDGGKCRISCLHKGLTPSLICYDVCSSTWNRYIHFELKEYLESGVKH